ncbi:MAG: TlpA family protein disulfide reductase [Betaproteobacteria bacterium]|nr:TlpA family protein disulfide reductase [Betaproteobacteria bacterium]
MKPIVALLCLLVALATPAGAAMPGEVPVGEMLRDLPLQGLNVPPTKVSAYRGKPLIINVWASWCAPCRAEMGSLDRLSKRYGRQFTVIGISTDDYPQNAYTFLEKSGTGFANFIDAKPWPLEHMLGANRLPLTVVVGPDGKVLGKFYGAREWDSPTQVELIARTLGIKL